jgi:FlaA1/EpsC-like NDP-sugar epimerase
VLGDVCDTKLLSEILQRYRPHAVYHAAAFKHVPLMETNPLAAAANNALGTYNRAKLVRASGMAKMLMISTDKAVNLISIMGASKRAAELALLNFDSPGTRMSAIRLGNVWGSPGSVVPAFFSQNFGRRSNYCHTPGGIEILLTNRRGRGIDITGSRT